MRVGYGVDASTKGLDMAQIQFESVKTGRGSRGWDGGQEWTKK